MCGRFVSPAQAAVERSFHLGLRNNNQHPGTGEGRCGCW
jgi:hypothetical protein